MFKSAKKPSSNESTIHPLQVFVGGDPVAKERFTLGQNVALDITRGSDVSWLYTNADQTSANFILHYHVGELIEETVHHIMALYGQLEKPVAVVRVVETNDGNDFNVMYLPTFDQGNLIRVFELAVSEGASVTKDQLRQLYTAINDGFKGSLLAGEVVAEDVSSKAGTVSQTSLQITPSDAYAAHLPDVGASFDIKQASTNIWSRLSPSEQQSYIDGNGIEHLINYEGLEGVRAEAGQQVKLLTTVAVDLSQLLDKAVSSAFVAELLAATNKSNVAWLRLLPNNDPAKSGSVSVFRLSQCLRWINISDRKDKDKKKLESIPVITVTLGPENKLTTEQQKQVLQAIAQHTLMQPLLTPRPKKRSSIFGRRPSVTKKTVPVFSEINAQVISATHDNDALTKLSETHFTGMPLHGVIFDGKEVEARVHGFHSVDAVTPKVQVMLYVIPSKEALTEEAHQETIQRLSLCPQPLVVVVYGKYQQTKMVPSNLSPIESETPQVQGLVNMFATTLQVPIVELTINLNDFNAATMLNQVLTLGEVTQKLQAQVDRTDWPRVSFSDQTELLAEDSLTGQQNNETEQRPLSSQGPVGQSIIDAANESPSKVKEKEKKKGGFGRLKALFSKSKTSLKEPEPESKEVVSDDDTLPFVDLGLGGDTPQTSGEFYPTVSPPPRPPGPPVSIGRKRANTEPDASKEESRKSLNKAQMDEITHFKFEPKEVRPGFFTSTIDPSTGKPVPPPARPRAETAPQKVTGSTKITDDDLAAWTIREGLGSGGSALLATENKLPSEKQPDATIGMSSDL